MITLTNEKKLELLKKVLNNAEVQLIEFITTRDFNKKMLSENPQHQAKIMPLIITIESDIKQTSDYANFIKLQIKETEKLKPEELSIIFENKKNEKS